MSPVDSYIASVAEPDVKDRLVRLCELCRQLLPGAEETLGYGIPTFKWNRKNVVHFAAFARHIGVYPGPEVLLEFERDLAGFQRSKGAVQFPHKEPLPWVVLEAVILRCRQHSGNATR